MKRYLLLLTALLIFTQVNYAQTSRRDLQQNAPDTGGGGGGGYDSPVADATELQAAIGVAASNPNETYDVKIVSVMSLPNSKTLPINIRLSFADSGLINIAAGQILTITNGQGLTAAPDKQIFGDAGNVFFTNSYPESVYPEWWGSDVLASCNKILLTYSSQDPRKAMHIVFANGKTYNFSGTWEIDSPVLAESNGGSGFTSTTLVWPSNTKGIVVHGPGTKTGIDNGRASGVSVFKNLRLQGGNAPNVLVPTSTVSANGNTITRQTGAAWIAYDGIKEGMTIMVGGWNYVISQAVDNNTVNVYNTILPVFTANGNNEVYRGNYAEFPTDGQWNGRIFSLNGVNYTIDHVQDGKIILTTPISTGPISGEGTPGEASISGLNVTNLPARINLYHGFEMREQARIEDCMILNFAGHGIGVLSGSYQGLNPTTPNANNSNVLYNKLYSNSGSGIWTFGENGNQILFMNNDATDNRGYGIWEHSFLGNTYIGNHTSFNYAGSRNAPINVVNYSTWLMEYNEGGEPAIQLGRNNIVLGGVFGTGFSASNQAPILQGADEFLNANRLKMTVYPDGGLVSKQSALWLGGIRTNNAILGFGALEEAASQYAGGTNYPAYQLNYDVHRNGWYSLNFKDEALSNPGAPIIMFSGSQANGGGAKLSFPQGFRFNPDDPNINRMLKGTVDINPASIPSASISSQNVTINGIVVGDSLILNVPATGLTTGLLVTQTYVSAVNTATIVFYNPTGGGIDDPNRTWNWSIIR